MSQPTVSYKVGVKTASDKEWCYNALRFSTPQQAENYGANLFSRWTLVEDYTVTECEDPVTEVAHD